MGEEGEIEDEMVIGEEDSQMSSHQRELAKSAYDMLQERKTAIEEIVAKMMLAKKQGQPKPQLRELVTQMFLHFVTLRQANRFILLEEDRIKSQTEGAKAPVDFTTLQLHNLMYEKNHYVKAIKACKDFRSKYPDIELVPEEEFFKDAPEEIKGSVISSDSAHNLMLNRLNFEVFQRKELCKLHEKLEHRKGSLSETIANRKKFLSSLPSQLKSLKKASLPAQNQLGILHSKKLKQQHSAELLPPPLYVLYSQLLAHKEAFGENIDIEIIGSLKDAEAYARQLAVKETGLSSNVENSRMEDDAPDEEDDGQRRRKRPRKVFAKENFDQAGIYQVHPLKTILHVYDDEISDPKLAKLISIKFEYLLKLNVVCVGIEGSNEEPDSNILCNLFPNDTGLDLPHQSAKLLDGEPVSFNERRILRPYKWAQHLAGIDFLPEISPMLSGCKTGISETAKGDAIISGLSLYRQQNRVLTIVRKIRTRKKAQLALTEQLGLLMKLKWPILSSEHVPWASHSPSCNIHSWSLVGPLPNKASSLPVIEMQQFQEHPNVDLVERSGTDREELENSREDGELPVAGASLVSDAKLTPSKVSNVEHSKRLALISKSITPSISKVKSQNFKRYDEEYDIMLDAFSDLDEPAELEADGENSPCFHVFDEKSWVDYGTKEFCLVLTKKTDKRTVKLEAKIKIGMEYPLRSPLFTLSFDSANDDNHQKIDSSEWYNELRAMEAEVNLGILKILPLEQENYILAHQVSCLAMLFDDYMDESSPSSDFISVVEVGLCKPVTGSILSRSFRGRDRRKMISWKDIK